MVERLIVYCQGVLKSVRVLLLRTREVYCNISLWYVSLHYEVHLWEDIYCIYIYIYIYLYLPIGLSAFGMKVALYQRDHMIFVLGDWLISLTEQNDLWQGPFCYTWQHFFLFNGWVVFPRVDLPQFLYPFLFQQASELFLCLY